MSDKSQYHQSFLSLSQYKQSEAVFLASSSCTHALRAAVAGVNHDEHLRQVLRCFLAAEGLDLPQQDSGHQVSGEVQETRPDGGKGQ